MKPSLFSQTKLIFILSVIVLQFTSCNQNPINEFTQEVNCSYFPEQSIISRLAPEHIRIHNFIDSVLQSNFGQNRGWMSILNHASIFDTLHSSFNNGGYGKVRNLIFTDPFGIDDQIEFTFTSCINKEVINANQPNFDNTVVFSTWMTINYKGKGLFDKNKEIKVLLIPKEIGSFNKVNSTYPTSFIVCK